VAGQLDIPRAEQLLSATRTRWLLLTVQSRVPASGSYGDVPVLAAYQRVLCAARPVPRTAFVNPSLILAVDQQRRRL